MPTNKKQKYAMEVGLPCFPGEDTFVEFDFGDYLNLSNKVIKKMAPDKWIKGFINNFTDGYSALSREEKIVFIYSVPGVRWMFLSQALNASEKKIKHFPFPSLEYTVLSSFDSEFPKNKIGKDDLISTHPAWEGIINDIEKSSNDSDIIDSCLTVFSIWPKAYKELKRWSTLNQEEKNILVLVLFSLATKANDNRLLIAIIEEISELKDYYPFLKNENNFNSSIKDDIVTETSYKKTLGQIVSLANRAIEEGLSLSTLDEIKTYYEQLESLRNSLSSDAELEKKFIELEEVLKESSAKLDLLDDSTIKKIIHTWSEVRLSNVISSSLLVDLSRSLESISNSTKHLEFLHLEILAIEHQLEDYKKNIPRNLHEKKKHTAKHKEISDLRFSKEQIYDELFEEFLSNALPQGKSLDLETPQDETPEDETPEDETPEDETPQDETPQDETPQDETPQDETRQFTRSEIEDISLKSKDIASNMIELPKWTEEQVKTLLNCLLREKKFELAYWLDFSLDGRSGFCPHVIECVQVGGQFLPGFSQSENRLGQLFIDIANSLNEINREEALLLASAVIRPALMAPYTHPAYIIKEVSSRLSFIPSFKEFAEKLESFVEKGKPLPDELVQGLNDRASWKSQKEILKIETTQWFDDANKRKMQYQAATRIWHHWAEKGGELYCLVEQSISADADLSAAEIKLERWENDASLEKILDKADQKINRRATKMRVSYSSRDQLRRQVQDATSIARRWLDLHKSKPQFQSGYLEHSRIVLEDIKKKAQIVLDELREYLSSATPSELRASSTSLYNAVSELLDDYKDTQPLNRIDSIEKRNIELLKIEGIDDLGRVKGDREAQIAILNQIITPRSASEAAKFYLDEGYLLKAETLLEVEKDSDISYEYISEKKRAAGKKVKSELQRFGNSIEKNILSGVLSHSDRKNYYAKLSLLEKEIEENPSNTDNILNAIRNSEYEIKQKSIMREKGLLARLENLKKLFDEKSVEIPESLKVYLENELTKENFTVVEEVLSRVENSIDLSDFDSDKVLAQFQPVDWFNNFTEMLSQVQKYAGDILKFKNSLNSRSEQSLISQFNCLDTTTKKSTDEALSWWVTLGNYKQKKRPLKTSPGDLFRVLRWLGFQIDDKIRLDEKRQGAPHQWQYYEIEAQIESPLPLFGSSSNSKHIIFLVWGQLDDDQIAQWLGSKFDKLQPITVLYFNCFGLESRRRTILACRKRGFCPLLIDQGLLLWLGTFKALDRTRALFGAGLSGGNLNPYTPEVAGGVPPEMFYGRKNDIDSLWNPGGACIIYGGRQLGKSALLQQVIRQYHDPSSEHYVLYSAAQHTVDLWDLFRNMLIDAGLIQHRAGGSNPDKIKTRVKELLDDKPNCRIVILLDECDNLLESDSKRRFEQMGLVRELMTETNRRFKVVLTGLHSVQRFQRIPNQPLAHFGEPICVGPLEPEDASQLIQKPLKTLGYKFSSESLVHRILANTNYHPSLIQLFCHDLVKYMLDTKKIDPTAPPFLIDEEVIATVYRQASLMKKMRDRFDWTLDLDPRYRAIGYTFAYMEVTERPESFSEALKGYRVQEVLIRVQENWPQGFSSVNIDELIGLLDELVGLGVLTGYSGKSYRLRSPNVLRLLGSEDDIEAELLRFIDAEYDPPAVPQVVRRVYKQSNDSVATSPLTLYQESELLQTRRGIDVVVGSKLSGISKVIPALKNLFGEKSENGSVPYEVKFLKGNDSPNEIKDYVRKLYQRNSKLIGMRVILIPDGMTSQNVYLSLNILKKWLVSLSTEKKFLKIIFVLDSTYLCQIRIRNEQELMDESGLVNVLSLRRWTEAGQGHWFHDVERVPSRAEQPKEWIDLTGGWFDLIDQLHCDFLEKENSTPEITIDHEKILKDSGIFCSESLEKIFRELSQLGDEVEREELSELVVNEELSEDVFLQLIDVLLDLDLVIGNRERFTAEPILSSALNMLKG